MVHKHDVGNYFGEFRLIAPCVVLLNAHLSEKKYKPEPSPDRNGILLQNKVAQKIEWIAGNLLKNN